MAPPLQLVVVAPPLQLVVVALVLRDKPAISALPHVAIAILCFLDPSGEMTLARACSFGSLRLLDHIWASSCVAAEDRVPGWSRFNWLRSDPVYYQWQFDESVKAAARAGRLDVIRWLFAHFEGCRMSKAAAEEATRHGHCDVLPLLLSLDLRVNQVPLADGLENRENEVEWGVDDMQNAARNGRADIARWLFENTPGWNTRHRTSRAVKAALCQGDVALVEWLVQRGCPFDPFDALDSGHEHVVRWMFQQQDRIRSLHPAQVMRAMASQGNLAMVQWILERNPPVPDQPMWQNCWLDSLDLACQHNHLPVVEWLMQRDQELGKRLLNEHPHAMHYAAVRGYLEVAKLLHAQEFGSISAKTMAHAAANGHLDVVKWLDAEFGSQVAFYLKLKDMFVHEIKVGTVLDAAAVSGHLDVLQLLHDLIGARAGGAARAEERKPWATQAAMIGAAAFGHLDVVQWLHYRQADGVTTEVMDRAACGGHLHVVQWLHLNRSEGCTTMAMDLASGNGKLDVVRWLHENRREGCTTAAMDSAARSGHLDVVKWLHENRSEGCTSSASLSALASGYPKIARWLLIHRPECAEPSVAFVEAAAARGCLDVLRWVRTHFPEKVALVKSASRAGQFEALLFLHSNDTRSENLLGGIEASDSEFAGFPAQDGFAAATSRHSAQLLVRGLF